jgi:tetratricopeptide (TPR) repeat protein
VQLQYHRALADYDRAIELNPAFVLALRNRLFVFYYRGGYERALSELFTSRAEVYTARGCAYQQQGNITGAATDIARAIQITSKPNLRRQAKALLLELRQARSAEVQAAEPLS